MVAAWINPNQGIALDPPAIVMALGDVRSAENLQAAANALQFTEAPRYKPTAVTFCNIAMADWCQILKAPLPHRFDLGDGRGLREMRANDIFDGLKAQRFPGWSETGSTASALAVKNLASVGIPQVAIWKNPADGHPGHIVGVIKSPPGDPNIWVVGAGGRCTLGCPLTEQFPAAYIPAIRFFAFKG